jgi:hypothetical protein
MSIACWIPTATNTHSEYVTLIAFPLQQFLHESSSTLRYTSILCLVFVVNASCLIDWRNSKACVFCNSCYPSVIWRYHKPNYWGSPLFPNKPKFRQKWNRNSCSYLTKITLLPRYKDKRESVEISNKMQLCNRMYYPNVYWRLNMFRAAYHSSSGALNCTCSLWFIYACSDLPLSSLSGNCSHSDLTTTGHHIRMQTIGCKYSLELLMMNGMLLKTCWAFNKLLNNTFYYKAASRWLFLLSHTAMNGSMNIKRQAC